MQRSEIKEVPSTFTLNTKMVTPPSELTKDMRMEIRLLSLNDLKPYRHQARKTFNEDEIRTLADTIAAHGIRNPLTVLFNIEEDVYEIVSGERRFKAAQMLGMEKIPCIILKDSLAAQEVSLIENIQRKDLHPVELYEGIQSYIDKNPNIQNDTLYNRIGISKTYFYKLLQLGRLSPEIRKVVVEKRISGSQLYALVNVPQVDQMEALQKPTAPVNLGDVRGGFERGMNKKCKVLQMSIKENRFVIDTNIFVLPAIKKREAIGLLKNVIEQIELELSEETEQLNDNVI